MTLVAVCSLKGSPGVTTVALGLAACWSAGEQPVVAECDPAGGDLLARFRLETSPGVVSLAAAARRSAEPGLLWQHTQRLPGGLPVVVGPAGADQARAALAQLSTPGGDPVRRAADRAGTVVIADCGRVAVDAAPDLVRAADVALVLCRAHDDALSHLAVALAGNPGWLRRTGIVLMGDGYPTPEIASALGVEIVGRVSEDPKGASVLGGLPGRRSTAGRSELLRSLVPIAASAADHADRRWRAAVGPAASGSAPFETARPRTVVHHSPNGAAR